MEDGISGERVARKVAAVEGGLIWFRGSITMEM